MERAIARRGGRGRSPESSSTPAVSPTPSTSTSTSGGDPGLMAVSLDAHEQQISPVPVPSPTVTAMDEPSVQLHGELESMQDHDDRAFLGWAKQPATTGLAARWLLQQGLDGTRLADRMLGLLYMARSKEGLGESAADVFMTREARHFEATVLAHLRHGQSAAVAPQAPAEDLGAAFTRAQRVLSTWQKQDQPKVKRLERQAQDGLQRLYARLLTLRAKKARPRPPRPSPLSSLLRSRCATPLATTPAGRGGHP